MQKSTKAKNEGKMKHDKHNLCFLLISSLLNFLHVFKIENVKSYNNFN